MARAVSAMVHQNRIGPRFLGFRGGGGAYDAGCARVPAPGYVTPRGRVRRGRRAAAASHRGR